MLFRSPLAAQLATVPLTTALSGQVSVVGVMANALAGPFVGPATVLGLAATVLIWVSPVAAAVAWVAGWVVQPILWIAHLGAAMPGAVLEWPTTPLGILTNAEDFCRRLLPSECVRCARVYTRRLYRCFLQIGRAHV